VTKEAGYHESDRAMIMHEDDDELSAVNDVDDINFELNHMSAKELIRIYDSEVVIAICTSVSVSSVNSMHRTPFYTHLDFDTSLLNGLRSTAYPLIAEIFMEITLWLYYLSAWESVYLNFLLLLELLFSKHILN
jgi:hypothetical protein